MILRVRWPNQQCHSTEELRSTANPTKFSSLKGEVKNVIKNYLNIYTAPWRSKIQSYLEDRDLNQARSSPSSDKFTSSCGREWRQNSTETSGWCGASHATGAGKQHRLWNHKCTYCCLVDIFTCTSVSQWAPKIFKNTIRNPHSWSTISTGQTPSQQCHSM